MSDQRPAPKDHDPKSEEMLEAKLKIAYRALSQIEHEAWLPRKSSAGVIAKIGTIAQVALGAIADLETKV